MKTTVREILMYLRSPEKGLSKAQGYGNGYRCYAIAENVTRMERIAETSDRAIRKTDEWNASEAEKREVDAANNAAWKAWEKLPEGKRPPAPETVKVSPETINALLRKDREIADTEIDFEPYLFDPDKMGDVDISMVGDGAEPSREEKLAEIKRVFWAFVARFDALKKEE